MKNNYGFGLRVFVFSVLWMAWVKFYGALSIDICYITSLTLQLLSAQTWRPEFSSLLFHLHKSWMWSCMPVISVGRWYLAKLASWQVSVSVSNLVWNSKEENYPERYPTSTSGLQTQECINLDTHKQTHIALQMHIHIITSIQRNRLVITNRLQITWPQT